MQLKEEDRKAAFVKLLGEKEFYLRREVIEAFFVLHLMLGRIIIQSRTMKWFT